MAIYVDRYWCARHTIDSNMKILAVDDDAVVRKILEVRLLAKKHEVHLADNGEDAVTMAGELSPDLIICDVMMPGLDGYRVCATLREMDIQTPFLFLTSRDASEDKVKGLESGADDYLTKPFDPIELEAKLAAFERRLKR